MSMYNALMGQNKFSGILLAALGFKSTGDVGRFRDAWVEKDEAGKPRIAIYTRNGGGNREHWDDEKEAGPDCGCPGCVIGHNLPAHPHYLFDQDDDFDCTYATIYFSVPEAYAEDLAAVAMDEPRDPSKAWLDLLAQLTGGQAPAPSAEVAGG